MKKIVLIFLTGLMLTLVPNKSSCQEQEYYYVQKIEQVQVPIETEARRYQIQFSRAVNQPDSLILVCKKLSRKMISFNKSIIEIEEIFIIYQDGMIKVVENKKDPVESTSYFIIGVILYVIIISLITILKEPPKFTGLHTIILIPIFIMLLVGSNIIVTMTMIVYLLYLIFRVETTRRSIRTKNKYITPNLKAEKIEFLAVLFITATIAIVASFFTMIIKL